jgi:hypothetical protein
MLEQDGTLAGVAELAEDIAARARAIPTGSELPEAVVFACVWSMKQLRSVLVELERLTEDDSRDYRSAASGGKSDGVT